MKNSGKKILHALILGLYLMDFNIPDELLEHLRRSNVKFENPSFSIIFSSLKNAPNLNDEVLRAMIIKSL